MPAHGKGLATIQHPWPVHTMIDFCREVLDFLVGKILPCRDRKSTRLNSSHGYISYAVFCLKKKNLQYHDVRRGKGLYNSLAATGKVERLVSVGVIEGAIMEPPEDTRAYFRGRCISRYPDNI